MLQEGKGYGVLRAATRELEVDVGFRDQQRRLQSVKHTVDGFSFDSFCHIDLMPRKLRDMATTLPAALSAAPLPENSSPRPVAPDATAVVDPSSSGPAIISTPVPSLPSLPPPELQSDGNKGHDSVASVAEAIDTMVAVTGDEGHAAAAAEAEPGVQPAASG
mmetsp:Transcript_16086/g.28600  ORF Transcript_16086/g.28600 Transcript_16086/m.28600 type:complete len:162 (+) Transcript_16086:1509-1994(+)